VTPDDVPDGPILVDTDVLSYLTARREARATEWRPLLEGHQLFMSFATYAEALQGGYAGRWGTPRMDQLRESLRQYTVVPFNEQVADLWARIHYKVRGHMQRQGVNDVWTAACALAVMPALPVATNNLTDFQAIASHASLSIIHPSL
jgi:predicted nucleic acid-binding protein